MLLALFGVSIIVFLMVHMVPGDPAMVVLGKRATPEALAEVRKQLGLDQPPQAQYFKYMSRVLQSDLGRSIKSHEKVSTEILTRLPATVELTFSAMLFASVLGICAGVLAATRRHKFLDQVTMFGALAGVSMPIFWLGLILILVFSNWLGLFPISGRLDARTQLAQITGFIILDSLIAFNFEALGDSILHLILPTIALGTVPLAVIARMTRSSMLEVLGQDYIKTAHAKGLKKSSVIFKHALKNSIIPVLTVIGLEFGYLMGGAILTETIFAWPGIGRWLWLSVQARDFPAIQGGVLFVATIFMIVNLIVDLLYAFFDPRIKY